MSIRAPKREPQDEPGDGFYPTGWWRAIDANGKILAETSSAKDFDTLGITGREDVTIQRLYEKTENEWRDYHK